MLINWRVTYNNGDKFKQYNDINDPENTENKYKDIDRSNINLFALYADNNLLLCYHFDGNKRLIYRRRVYKRPGLQDVVTYLVGWQENIRGKNVQSISVLFPDGHIEIIDRWQENMLFDAPEPISGEDWE
ncbi:MAG: hypothetical protein ACTSQE_07345 [Candidatus Heimdallarchaeaceae archaeon]